jgi:hypothetical protein
MVQAACANPSVLAEVATGSTVHFSEEPMNTPDPAIDEVREVRRQISERFGHDPARLVEHYMMLQEQHRERLLPPKQSSTGKSSA